MGVNDSLYPHNIHNDKPHHVSTSRNLGATIGTIQRNTAMPFYQVYHSLQLTDSQQQQIASAITEIHTRVFTSLSALVNVDFVDVSSRSVFVAGYRHKIPNTIQGGLRDGPTRTRAMYEQLCHELITMWDNIARNGETGLGEDELRVFLTGGMLAAVEGGFLIPEAGGDGDWFKENMTEIKKRAEAGQLVSQIMLEDMGRLGHVGLA